MEPEVDVLVVGGGISGLTLALQLHQRGIRCRVYEAAPAFRELGVGVSLLPHGAKELAALGLLEPIRAKAVRYRESVYANRFGQIIYRDSAESEWPQFLIHRADLHGTLAAAVVERLGRESVVHGHTAVDFEQDDEGVTVQFVDSRTGERLGAHRARVLIACDGIRSRIRGRLYPDEPGPVFSGITMWRGVTVHPPILSGGSHLSMGTADTEKMVIYPIRENVDGRGNQLMNWVAEVNDRSYVPADWSRPGNVDDVLPRYAEWRFDWLDVPALIRGAEQIYEYPMCDRDPVDRWVFDRVALVGDAAHAMLPRGSNGAVQAIIDARVVAEQLARHEDPRSALRAYEEERLERVNRLVLTNRTTPPDSLMLEVKRRTADAPFERIEDVISEDEIREILDRYKRVAGFDRQALQTR